MVDNNAISIKSLESYYGVKAKTFQKQYKHQLSDFNSWKKKSHCTSYLMYPKNIGYELALDETSLSDGELDTVLTNKANNGLKDSIFAIIKGTKSDYIIEKIKQLIADYLRNKVMEISLDMPASMNLIAKKYFPVIDRFHVQKLAIEAVQYQRIKYRWEAIKEEKELVNKAKKDNIELPKEVFENGDSCKQLLAKSLYLMY